MIGTWPGPLQLACSAVFIVPQLLIVILVVDTAIAGEKRAGSSG